MINKIEIVNLKENVNLHLMKSNKFKTDLIGISLKRQLREEEATMNTLITRILERGTQNYPTIKELNNKLSDLYGAIIVADVTKYGEKQVMQFKCQVPNKRHIEDKDIYRQALELLNEIITKPFTENGLFSRDYFNQEKENLRDEIASLKNDKVQYSVERCLEVMCPDEPYRIHQYGSIEMLDKITLEDLYEHYINILDSSKIDIITNGDLDFKEVREIIEATLDLDPKNVIDIEDEDVYRDVSKVKKHNDYFKKVSQGKIAIGYRSNVKFSDPLYEASMLFSGILGGGGNSKLFMNVREKESLCYYIFSRVDKYKGIMLVSAGVEFENFEKVHDLIDENFRAILEGDFTDSDIRIAKDAVISSINSISDYPNSFINFYYSQSLSNMTFDLEALKRRIENVTKEEIIEAGKRIQKDTEYYLYSDEMREA